MCILPAYVPAHHVNAWCYQRHEESQQIPGTEVTDCSKCLYGYWKDKPTLVLCKIY